MSLRKTSRTIVISIIAACLMMSVPCCTYAAGEEGVQTYNVERDRERADEYYEKAVENAERAYYRAMEEVQSGRPGKLLNGRSTGEWVFETLYGSTLIFIRNCSIFGLKNNFFHSILFLSLFINQASGRLNNSLYLLIDIFNKDNKYKEGINLFENLILLLFIILS